MFVFFTINVIQLSNTQNIEQEQKKKFWTFRKRNWENQTKNFIIEFVKKYEKALETLGKYIGRIYDLLIFISFMFAEGKWKFDCLKYSEIDV